MALYRALGMHPLRVRAEIDAHIADRLLEAVWREALWLVNDGIATTEEIDDAIRYGFGLRWAQMGLFETYRIAGGLGGMRHFIAQFGECLSWPWTKLMDTPELTDELIDTIASAVRRPVRRLRRARAGTHPRCQRRRHPARPRAERRGAPAARSPPPLTPASRHARPQMVDSGSNRMSAMADLKVR